jgi:transcription-repair coupling factor (superfamily II helicase)
LQKNRLTALLSEFKPELEKLIELKKIEIDVVPIKAGFISKKDSLAVLTDYQIFNKPYRTKISSKQKIRKHVRAILHLLNGAIL